MAESFAASSVHQTDDNQNHEALAHPAFSLQRRVHIESLKLWMEEYEHKVTGAKHYHLQADNPENVFLVAFRTVPMDSTGVAHILEHTSLCGSKKYPVRDPFFMMIRRSLNTFMNAFTSSDWTAYPFASMNRKDFNNLLSVYLDAAFFARLDELDFAQEGHRLEFAEPENPDSELQYKGVVYNEMKGAMSSTNSVLWHTLSKHLFPTTTYHYNSGGEPDDIPDLSYADLREFYRSHYHPSNAVFMTFGDITAAEHQAQFEELALRHFDRLDIHIAVTDEKRYQAPLRVQEYYAAESDESNKTHVVLAWLLGHSTDLDELYRAQLLSAVLMDNSASPLLKILETSSLGSAPSPMCGLEDSNREMSFMAGLEGCQDKDIAEVEKLILSALKQIAEEGVDPDQVEAALHQLELNQREISGDSYPYGLQLILSGLSTAIHRGDPISVLNVDPVLEQLRKDIQDPQFVPQLIRSLLLENQHRLTLSLLPDKGLAERKSAAEKARLGRIKSSLDEQQIQTLVDKAKALAERQAQQDDPEELPKVGLDDVPTSIKEPQLEQRQVAGMPLTLYQQGTNGLSYQQIVVSLPSLPDELHQQLALYTGCVPELGVGDKDYAQVQTWQSAVSGGLNCFTSLRGDVNDVQQISGYLGFSSKCLSRHHGQLCDLLEQTFHRVRFDEAQRVAELVDQIAARKIASITGQGHVLAMSLASSGMSPLAKAGFESSGLAGIKRLRLLQEQLAQQDARHSLLESFRAIHDLIAESDRQLLLITEPEEVESHLQDLESRWQQSSSPSVETAFKLPETREQVRAAWSVSTQVNFCAKAFPTVPAGHADNAALHVLAGYLRNGFLHRAIREKGGAYGGGASQDAGSASFRFFSYRDPRLQDTLDDFDRAVDWLVNEEQPDYQLEEAILGVIASLDKPSSPAGEAKQAFYNHLFGRTLEMRQEFRSRVLATTLEDLRRVAQAYLRPEQASIGVITNSDGLSLPALDGFEKNNLS